MHFTAFLRLIPSILTVSSAFSGFFAPDRLLPECLKQDRIVFVNQIDHSKQQNHRDNSDGLLVAAHILLPLVASVTETAFDVGTGHIWLILLGEIAIFLATLLCLRVIETRTVVEAADFLLAEKTEIESHNRSFAA